MNEIYDNRILTLYIIALQGEAAGITCNQKLAIEHLKECALKGNSDADAALHRLKHLPYIHPFLKEGSSWNFPGYQRDEEETTDPIHTQR